MTKHLKIPAPPSQQKTLDGRFRLVRQIGRGATGQVFEGVQLSVDRRVAVKILHPSHLLRDDYQQRFATEAKAIARLNHTNCITLFDFGYSEQLESLYMVTEYVEGRELFEVLRKEEPDLRTVLGYMIEIAEAVAHAHQHNILHRDLKPENVLISPEGVAKVLDFGMARVIDELVSQQGARLTEEGAVYGTPAYMSPEQCQGRIDITAQADIYALGVMLYEVVQGELPFRAKKIVDLLTQHVTEPVPPVDVEMPPRLKQLIYSMLEKEAEHRPSSAQIVADTLRSILSEIPAELADRRSTLDFPDAVQNTLLQYEASPPVDVAQPSKPAPEGATPAEPESSRAVESPPGVAETARHRDGPPERGGPVTEHVPVSDEDLSLELEAIGTSRLPIVLASVVVLIVAVVLFGLFAGPPDAELTADVPEEAGEVAMEPAEPKEPVGGAERDDVAEAPDQPLVADVADTGVPEPTKPDEPVAVVPEAEAEAEAEAKPQDRPPRQPPKTEQPTQEKRRALAEENAAPTSDVKPTDEPPAEKELPTIEFTY